MPFLPIHDDNPRRHIETPYVTWLVMLACVLVFIWQSSLSPRDYQAAVFALGTVPVTLFSEARVSPEIALVPAWATLVTSTFLHGGVMHLVGNMLYLYIFGDNVEDSLGHARFVFFYLACGIVASLGHSVLESSSPVPLIGASGAIAGVLGAYLLLHPRARITVLLPFFIPMRIPAIVLIGIWFLVQVVNMAGDTGERMGGTAWGAHVGGFLAGLVLLPMMRRRDVRLLD